MDKRIKFSIIVPVYNTEKYIDQCLNSIINQSYDYFEVILVNDGSTDNSLLKCAEWEKKDSRIRLITKENEGLGPTRNCGVANADGDYLLFIDSDDWYDNELLNMLAKEIKQSNPDVVYFDFTIFDELNNTYTRSYENAQYINCDNFVSEKLNKCLLPSSCLAAYKRTAWNNIKISFPACFYEDNAVFPLIIIGLENRRIIDLGGYYYRTNTGKSITQSYDNNFKRTEPLEYLISRVDDELLYKNEVYNYCYNQLETSLEAIYNHIGKKEYLECMDRFNDFLEGFIPGNKKFLYDDFYYWGSYTIGHIGNFVKKHDIKNNRFNFSSFITLQLGKSSGDNLQEIGNDYRKEMFYKERRKDFYKIVSNNNKKVILIDFMEERLPILKTISDDYFIDYDYIRENINESFEEIAGEERFKIWKEAWSDFYNKISNETRVIILKLYLAEKYKKNNKEYYYKDLQSIRSVNKELELYYSYVENNFDIEIVNIDPMKMVTDSDYKYGCLPIHYSASVNKYIADIVKSRIDGKR